MKEFENEEYKVFDLFKNQWGLVTAGTMDEFNTCTVSWGSLGTIWTRVHGNGSIVTVYIHPSRYTCSFMKKFDTFSLCFFPKEYKKALSYLGTHSSRTENKVEASGLTPIALDGTVAFAEAERTFVCKKLYQHPFAKEGLSTEVKDTYLANPQAYPRDEQGEWQPHWMFIGEILTAYTSDPDSGSKGLQNDK